MCAKLVKSSQVKSPIIFSQDSSTEISIAYLVLAHEDPKQLRTLSDEVTKNADIFIHINKKSDITPFTEECSKSEHKDRIFFADKRFIVRWGGLSIVKATFELLELALSKSKYDRIVLLTGLDYPIKSGQEIAKFFTENRNFNYVTANKKDIEKDPIHSYKYYHDNIWINRFFRCCRKFLPIPILIRKKDFTDYKGERYFLFGNSPKWALTGECAEYLLNFWRNNPGFNNDFTFRHAPDDTYVATVLNNSRFKNTIREWNELFLVNWDNEKNRTYDISDYDDIIKASQLYAKKFYSGRSDSLIQAMHEHWSNLNE